MPISHLSGFDSILWLLLGLLAVSPLLGIVERTSLAATQKLLGISLVIAALVYVAFALWFGQPLWLLIEAMGLLIYGGFYWLARQFSWLWLAVGWLLHPLWDVVLHVLGPGQHITPAWYAIACVSFDFAVAIYIVYRVKIRQPHQQTESEY